MPGPRMGPRPDDFDDDLVRRSPTFQRWMDLVEGGKLRYACRDFIKGHGDDEERLMRRIMIARRNNVRDHEALKRARRISTAKEPPERRQALQQQSGLGESKGGLQPLKDGSATPQQPQQQPEKQQLDEGDEEYEPPSKVLKLEGDEDEADMGKDGEDRIEAVGTSEDGFDIKMIDGGDEQHPHPDAATPQPHQQRRRRPSTLFSDAEVAREMDVPAVEATRSYRTWAALAEGAEFVYNQKYIKGRAGHDWLLRKNVWRRMRYRRENKKMVDQLVKATDSTRNNSKAKNGTAGTLSSGDGMKNPSAVSTASRIVDQALLSTATASVVISGILSDAMSHAQDLSDTATTTATAAAAAAASMLGDHHSVSSAAHAADTAAVEAAVAVAESYAKSPYNVVHNPLEATTPAATTLALDAAAQLAAAAASSMSATSLDSEELVLAAAVTGHEMAEATEAAMNSVAGAHHITAHV